MGTIKALKDFNATKEQALQEIGFHVSKEIDIKGTSFPQGEFLVDDINKRFAVRYILSTKTNNPFALYKYETVLQVLNYSDLGIFELIEDGNTITKGKGVATAIGSMTFGIAGALVGSSGKRKTENTCFNMTVRIFINTLQAPKIDVVFISSEVSKKSAIYKEKLKQAQELIATLNYIASNS